MQTMEREGSFSFRSTRLSGTKLEKKASSPGGEESSYGGKRAMSALERAEIGKSVKQVHQKKENFIEKMLEKVDNGVDSCMSASGLDRLCLNCACMLPVCCRPIGHKEKTPEEEAMGWRAENVIEELGEADIKEAHSAYNLFDADGDGKISLYELRELLCVIGQVKRQLYIYTSAPFPPTLRYPLPPTLWYPPPHTHTPTLPPPSSTLLHPPVPPNSPAPPLVDADEFRVCEHSRGDRVEQ